VKRYLLFYGDNYYPSGGWDDFKGDFDSVDEAKVAFEKQREDWGHVVDVATGTVTIFRE
jgi:hypothetical protein